MSTETTPEARAEELAAELGDAIAKMDAYETFLDAKRAVEADEELSAEVREVERRREEFAIARQAGEATNEDLRELQAAQRELHEKPTMREYMQAQSELELLLQELDHVISEPLAVDFGETAGGCCQD